MNQHFAIWQRKSRAILPKGSGLNVQSRQNCHMALFRLNELRGKTTLEKLSGETGISVSQLSRYASGKRDPSLKHLQILARRFNVSVQDLTNESRRRPVPIVGYVGAGGEENYEPLPGDDEIEADAPDGTVAVLIRGSSLGPGFDGWFALYSERRDPFTEDLLNRLCVVETEDGRTLLKWVRRGPGEGHNLISGTGDIEENVRILRAAPVIELRPR